MQKCPSCDRDTADDAIFCGYCGHQYEQGAKRTMLGMAVVPKEAIDAHIKASKAKAAEAALAKAEPKAEPPAPEIEDGRKATLLMTRVTPEDLARAAQGTVEVNIPIPQVAPEASRSEAPALVVSDNHIPMQTQPIMSPLYEVSVDKDQGRKGTLMLSSAGKDEPDEPPILKSVPEETKSETKVSIEGQALSKVTRPLTSSGAIPIKAAVAEKPSKVTRPLTASGVDSTPKAPPEKKAPDEPPAGLSKATLPLASSSSSSSAPIPERSTMMLTAASPDLLGLEGDALDGWPDPESFSVEGHATSSEDIGLADTFEGSRAEVLQQIHNIGKASPEAEPEAEPEAAEPEAEPEAAVDSTEALADTFEGSREEVLKDIGAAAAAEKASSPPVEEASGPDEAPAPDPPAPSESPKKLKGTAPAQPTVPDAALMGQPPSRKTPPTRKHPKANKKGQPTALIRRSEEEPEVVKETLVLSHTYDEDEPLEPQDRRFTFLKWGIVVVTVLLVFAMIGLGVAWFYVKGKKDKKGSELLTPPDAVVLVVNDGDACARG